MTTAPLAFDTPTRSPVRRRWPGVLAIIVGVLAAYAIVGFAACVRKRATSASSAP